MKLLAGFFLDPLWVILQLRDFVRVQLVFLLELLNILLNALIFRFLGAVYHHAIGPERHMHEDPDSKDSHGNGSDPAPQFKKAHEIRFKSCLNAAGPGLSLIGPVGEGPEPCFR